VARVSRGWFRASRPKRCDGRNIFGLFTVDGAVRLAAIRRDAGLDPPEAGATYVI